jgi:hypothetical protein
LILTAANIAFGQYTMQPSGPAPSDLPAAYTAQLQADGYKILNASGAVYCEVWFVKTAPSGPRSTEDAVTLPTIPQGALLGVIRFGAPAADRRGQSLKAGTYTMRYGNYPVNGDHQGVAPQRDFAVLAPISTDPDPAAKPAFDAMIAQSRKASNTPHPAVLSIWASGSDVKAPSFAKEGDHDWVLNAKMGDTPVSIILVGKAES